MNNIDILKSKQRKTALVERKNIFQSNQNAHLNLFVNLKETKLFLQSKIIASYYSINSEIQTEDINNKIIESGKILSLPVINSNKSILTFREFNKNTNMNKGNFNIMEPDNKSTEVIPDLILLPCLAFDNFGGRLGYGGGYYDKTIYRFKKLNLNFKMIIVAFSRQKVNKVFTNNFDQKINYILTEKKLLNLKIL